MPKLCRDRSHLSGARMPKSPLRRRIEQAEQLPNPLGVTNEVTIARGLLQHKLDMIERARDLNNADVAALAQLINTISTLIDRTIQARNQTAFTKTELRGITSGMQSILDEFIPDPSQRRAFLARLRNILPEPARADAPAKA